MKTRLPLTSINVLALFAFFAFGVSLSLAQDDSKQTAKPTRSEISLPPDLPLTALKQTAAQISRTRPDIPASVLMADAQIIKDSLPQVTTEFAKVGLTDSEALWASQTAWKTARLRSPLRLNPEKTIDANSFVEYVTGDLSFKIVRWRILNENPEIKAYVLEKDRRLIAQAQPDIEASFKASGWSVTDARYASIVAWRTARLESPLGPSETIDIQSFIEAAGDIGIMVFTSEPDQAEVFINSRKIGTTNKEKNEPLRYFPDGKKVSVRFVKPEFAPLDLECLAKGQDTVICKAELKRQ